MYFSNVINNPIFSKVIDGKVFKIAHRFEDIADATTVYLYFQNPSNSGRIFTLATVEVVSQGQGRIDISKSFTVDSAGTDITPINLNFGSNETSKASVKHGGSYSNITQHLSIAVPGGTSIRAFGALSEVGEFTLMPADSEILIQFTNTSASTIDCSVMMIWVEDY